MGIPFRGDEKMTSVSPILSRLESLNKKGDGSEPLLEQSGPDGIVLGAFMGARDRYGKEIRV
jgi:hypothetical protein